MMIKLLTLSVLLITTSTSYGGLEWAQEHFYTKNSIEFFCKPGDLVLSSSQLRSLINKEIQENNSFYNKYKDAPLLGLALRNAYIENFPCQ